MKPTPGPWSASGSVHGWTVWGQETSPDAEPVDMVAVASEMTEADARLCAAAPALLAALEDVLNVAAHYNPNAAEESGHACTGDMSLRCVWCRARAAVAKARGES